MTAAALREAIGRDALADAMAGRPILVAGLGITGTSAVTALLGLGADVTVVDGGDSPLLQERAAAATSLGATVRLGGDGLRATAAELADRPVTLALVSPGWRPDAPVLAAVRAGGGELWGDVELARRMRPDLPWLAVTGTNGKSTTVRMTEAMLRAAGYRTIAAGNIGLPLLDVVADPSLQVIAVELGSFQLHYSSGPRAVASVVLNIAADHLDWHGSMDAYAAAKGRIHRGAQRAVVYNCADPMTRQLAVEADAAAGCRAIGFTLGAPAAGEMGVVEELLVDRVFAEPGEAIELAELSDIVPFAPHNVANALAAAALTRAFGVEPTAVRDGLRGFRPEPHRLATVATVAGVAFVDDSKATNAHAADAALRSFHRIVWIAGGLAKGQQFDDLVEAHAARLAGVVLLGADRALIADALARHAPDVPVIDIDRTDDSVMETAVRAAAGLAHDGDTVLLAPACASMDLFTDYGHRGESFAAAVRGLAA